MKYCKQCDTTKPKTEFYKSKSQPSGLRGYCKTCCKNPVRKQREKLATPKWSDTKTINKLKKQRTAYNKMHGSHAMTIGHIIPIHGVNPKGEHIVCGLNIPQNIELESGKENYKKGNRITTDELNQIGRAA